MSETERAASNTARFLKNIQALKSLLSAQATSEGPSIAELKKQVQVLSVRLQDALQSSERQQKLYRSLEKAFDQLIENRKELKRLLDQATSLGNHDGNTKNLKERDRGVNLETRILSVEVEKIEALRSCEETRKKLAISELQITTAKRRIQGLEATLTSQKLTFQEQEAKHQAQRTEDQATSCEMEMAHTKREHELVDQVTQSEERAKSLEKSVEKLKQALEDERKDRAILERQVRFRGGLVKSSDTVIDQNSNVVSCMDAGRVVTGQPEARGQRRRNGASRGNQ